MSKCPAAISLPRNSPEFWTALTDFLAD